MGASVVLPVLPSCFSLSCLFTLTDGAFWFGVLFDFRWRGSVKLSSCLTVTPSSLLVFSFQISAVFLFLYCSKSCYWNKRSSLSGCISFACSSQKEAEQEELEAGKAVHYTWTEPTGSRELCWKCGTYSGKLSTEKVAHLNQIVVWA